MAQRKVPSSTAALPQYSQSSASLAQELKYEQATRAFELICKNEELRQLRQHVLLLEDENDDIFAQLSQADDEADSMREELQDFGDRVEGFETEMSTLRNELRMKEREVETLRAEVKSTESASADHSKLLSEKLALARELANLRPELEHLRAQAATHTSLLSEKLSLQRELSTVQVELETEKRATQRAILKRRSSTWGHDLESKVDDLQRELRKEKRLKEQVQKSLKDAQDENEANKSLDDLKSGDAKDLNKERRERLKAEKAVKRLEAELETEQQARAEAEEQVKAAPATNGAATVDPEAMAQLREELNIALRERQKAERAASNAAVEWEAQKALLDDKLNQFRTKLRSTKEKLKETEGNLQEVQSSMNATQTSKEVTQPARNIRKRAAVHMEADHTIGTPGDAAKPKRSKRVESAVGDKSTFSITPFLNRTMSVAPSTPEVEAVTEGGPVQEAEETPTAAAKAVKRGSAKKVKVVAPAASKEKSKPRKKATSVPTLEIVAEETSQLDPTATLTTGTMTMPTTTAAFAVSIPSESDVQPEPTKKPQEGKNAVLQPKTTNTKSRKSLLSFAAFTKESPPEKKKKRRLGGGGNTSTLGSTIFDLEDHEETTAANFGGFGGAGKGLLFGTARGLGGLKKNANLKAGASGTITTQEGFVFSPLKKDRKAMARAARA